MHAKIQFYFGTPDVASNALQYINFKVNTITILNKKPNPKREKK